MRLSMILCLFNLFFKLKKICVLQKFCSSEKNFQKKRVVEVTCVYFFKCTFYHLDPDPDQTTEIFCVRSQIRNPSWNNAGSAPAQA
jgi:hypothetical protein